MYEVSPDFGMMCQAWNIYSFGYPIVRQFFGVQPNPEDHTVTVDLAFPSTWNHPQLKGIRIGEGSNETFLDITYLKGEGTRKNQIMLLQEGASVWTLRTSIPEGATVTVDEMVEEVSSSQNHRLEVQGRKVIIRW
jgi:hypothetical protein